VGIENFVQYLAIPWKLYKNANNYYETVIGICIHSIVLSMTYLGYYEALCRWWCQNSV